MSKKSLKITLFSVFVLVLFSSCVKNVKECKFLPKIEIESQKNSESDEKNDSSTQKLRKMIENGTPSAHVSCNF
jgi:hypothetical protein